jgi:hypothetical protein
MKKLIVVLIGSCLLFTDIHAQFTRYVVKLKNKGANPFSLSTPLAICRSGLSTEERDIVLLLTVQIFR